MATGTGRRHVMLLFTVLAGLFLMHGVSAPSMHGMPMPQKDSIMAASMTEAPATPAVPAAPTVSGAVPTADHMGGCGTCVPLRPEDMTGLFLALFLIVITLWRPRLPPMPRLIHPHWPHGPPRTGVQTLRTLSISRT